MIYSLDLIKLLANPKPNYDQALVKTMMNASLDAFITIDQESLVLEWNVAAERIFGYYRYEVVGKELVDFIIPHGLRNKHRVGLRRFLKDGQSNILNKRIEVTVVNKDEVEFPVELTIIPVETDRGYIFTASIRDLTKIKSLKSRQDLVSREYKHRLKNLLSVIVGLAKQTLHGEDSPNFLARLFAMSRVQDLLAERDWTNAVLSDIVEQGIYPYDKENRFRVQGVPYKIPSQAAVSFSLVIHELCTNAVKYGALSTEEGYVNITWTDLNGILVWSWQEFGGPPVKEPEEKGFGYRLINRAFSGEGETLVEFLPTGFKCTLKLQFKEALDDEKN